MEHSIERVEFWLIIYITQFYQNNIYNLMFLLRPQFSIVFEY